MFLHEKGVDIPAVDLDMLSGENRDTSFLKKNPSGQLPALELDDGRVIAESVAICEFFEEHHPEPALIGRTAEERAETCMWQRRRVSASPRISSTPSVLPKAKRFYVFGTALSVDGANPLIIQLRRALAPGTEVA